MATDGSVCEVETHYLHQGFFLSGGVWLKEDEARNLLA